MSPLRVMVVDDSPFNRRVVSDFFETLDSVEVVGHAGDGDEALRVVAELRPDLITLDLGMPRLDGFTFLRVLMARQPTPVIIVSGNTDSQNVFRALELGAIDFVAKPAADEEAQLRFRTELHRKVEVARELIGVDDWARRQGPSGRSSAREAFSNASHSLSPGNSNRVEGAKRVSFRPSVASSLPPSERKPSIPTARTSVFPDNSLGATGPLLGSSLPPSHRGDSGPRRDGQHRDSMLSRDSLAPRQSLAPQGHAKLRGQLAAGDAQSTLVAARQLADAPSRLIVIGASTGGPNALVKLLEKVPRRTRAAVVIAQHMPPKFTTTFAERLNRVGGMRVLEARDGLQALRPGHALLCPGGRCIEISSWGAKCAVEVVQARSEDHFVPSVNRLFESAARVAGEDVLALLLTGMGDDGVRGTLDIGRARGRVWVESRETAAIYGMPGAAVREGHVDRSLALHSLAEMIIDELV